MTDTSDTTETFDTEALAETMAEAAWDMKARRLRVLDVRGIVSYTDFLVVCHGTSDRHARAVAESVISELRPYKIRPIGIEGQTRGDWILVDFADAILHVFNGVDARGEYNLESIYSDAPRLVLETPQDLEDEVEETYEDGLDEPLDADE